MTEVRKFYIRYREGVPETPMHYAAQEGFRQLGVEVAPFTWIDDVDEVMHDLGPEVGLAGYIGDVWRALKKLGRPTPAPVDYPVELLDYLGRVVRQTTLGKVRGSTARTFVKPVEHKLFTGFVYNGDGDSRMRLVTLPDEVPVWVSDVIDFRSEHRVFVLKGEIVDVRRYKGDWALAPHRGVIEQAVCAWKSKPAACALDFGVMSGHWTGLVEANDGFALGGYGIASVDYAKMLSARWHELVRS